MIQHEAKLRRRQHRNARGKGRGRHRRLCDLQHYPFDQGEQTIRAARADVLRERAA